MITLSSNTTGDSVVLANAVTLGANAGTSGSPGSINFQNQTAGQLKLVTNGGQVSAIGGTINFNQPGQPVIINGAGNPNTGSIIGTLTVTGQSLDFNVNGDLSGPGQSLHIGDIQCPNGNVTIKFGISFTPPIVELVQDSGSIRAQTLTLNIANDVGHLQTVGVSALVLNTGSIDLLNTATGTMMVSGSAQSLQGTLPVNIETSLGMTVGSLTTALPTSLIADTSILTVSSGAHITTASGSLSIQNKDTANGSIVLNNAQIEASSPTLGNVSIFLGSGVTNKNPVGGQAGVTVSGTVFFGANGINAIGTSTATAANSKIIHFDTNAAAKSKLTIGPGAAVTAGQ